MNLQQPIDVFISRKSEDAPLAKPLYDFLKNKGLRVFDSDHSLPELGNADYQRAIDYALESCEHMIVVGSSVENICSSWVDAEWRLFINEKRSGNKKGNILTVVSPEMNFKSLPVSLRYYEVISMESNNYERIYSYVLSYTPPLRRSFPQNLSSSISKTKKATIKEIESWIDKGDDYYDQKDFENCVIYYTKAAEQGNIDGQYNLGFCFENGHGVGQDFIQAMNWYQKAAEQGSIFAKAKIKTLQKKKK